MRRLISVIAATSLVLSVPAVASGFPTQAPAAGEPRISQTAKKTTITTNAAGLIKGLNTAPPLYVGYKAGEFLPVGAKAKKDRRGCTYSKQLLISMATKKPKVGKKCKLTGGTWSVNFGTKVQKGSKGLRVVPIIDDKSAWGQGASTWTTEQRAAWAKNTGGGTKATATQSTNQVVTSKYLKQINSYAKLGAAGTRSLPKQVKNQALTRNPNLAPAIIIGVIATAEIIGGAVAVAIKDDEPDSQPAELKAYCANTNPLVTSFLTNSAAWGLSIDNQIHVLLAPFYGVCPTSKIFQVAFESVIAAASFTEAASSTGQDSGVAEVDGGDMVSAAMNPNAVSWKTYTDYAAPTGSVTPGELFGIHVPDIGSQPRPARSFPNIPVGYVRLWDSNTSWRSLEPNVNGTYEWTTLDLGVQRIRDAGAKVMMVLGYTPAWASASGAANAAPTNFDDYSEYVRSVACRYGDAVSSYEVWNEGNLDTFWTGTPEQLADLTQRAYTEIKKCSNAQVIAASTGTRASGPFASNFLPYLQALGAKGWPIDGYSVHSYPSASGGADARLDGLKQFKAVLASVGAPVKPIYDTELNYGLAGLGEPHVDLNQDQSAAAIIRSYVDSVRFGVTSTFWFLWTTDYYDKLGIQLNPDAVMNGVAWTQAWKWLVGSRLQRCSEFALGWNSGQLTSCQFTGVTGENYTVMWTETGKQARVQINGLGTQKCDAWGECVRAAGSVIVTDVPIWVGNPGGLYGPATAMDPNAPQGSVPGAPRIYDVSFNDNVLTVDLTAPVSDGGSPITSYEVTVTDINGEESKVTTTGRTDISVPITQWVASVNAVAINAFGTSPASPAFTFGSCGTVRAKPLWTFSCTDFGDAVPVGGAKIQPIVVTNQSAKSHFLTFTVTGSGFSLAKVNKPGACAPRGVLGARGTCVLYVAFQPTKAGAAEGKVVGSASSLQAYQGKLIGRGN
jgi:hypothetical protein